MSKATFQIEANNLDIRASSRSSVDLSFYADTDELLDQIDVEYIKDYFDLVGKDEVNDCNE